MQLSQRDSQSPLNLHAYYFALTHPVLTCKSGVTGLLRHMVNDIYSVQISQQTAKELIRNGATILLLDVPVGTVVGIDQQVSS